MANLMIEAKNKKELEEDSVFDETPEIVKRSSKQVLKDIASNCASETKFKVICNKLYKLVNRHLTYPKNPLNSFVAIMSEDYDNNAIVASLIDELCEKHELITELKPKGILVKINPGTFQGQYVSLKSVLVNFKDESVGIGGDTRSRKEKVLAKAARGNTNTNERVQAMREAQMRRQQMGQNPTPNYQNYHQQQQP